MVQHSGQAGKPKAPAPRFEKYANDAAIIGDGFGPTIAGDQVARMALEVETPFTIGVTGKWGSGKTSVMRRAFATLGGEPLRLPVPLAGDREDRGKEGRGWQSWSYSKRGKTLRWHSSLVTTAERSLCIWYSPWQHQSADNPLVPLLLEMREQFSTWIKVKRRLTDINRRGGLAGIALIERVIDAAASIARGRSLRIAGGATQEIRTAWREAAADEPGLDDGQRFHLLFEDAIETLLESLKDDKQLKRGRVIIFIDDLDRCEEDVVVELLESIKLYLGSQHCVFVLAIDESAVLDALTRHWPGRSEETNREYLEKLFQAIVPVPVPELGAVQQYVAQQLLAHKFPAGSSCAEMIVDLIEPNPRKIKNFVNSACAVWSMFRRGSGAGRKSAGYAERFILFHYLRTYHKEVWRLLERQPWSLRILTKVLTDAPEQALDLEEAIGVDPADQRVLEALLFRAFSHVMKHTGEDEQMHRYLPLGEAVDLLNQRIDRKRSDEELIRYYKDLIAPDTDLPDEFLYLPRGS
jgi:hypothetical protein